MNKEIDKAIDILQNKGILLYPTDTVWGIGCDATDAEAVQRVYQLKKRSESKALICLVADRAMLNRYVDEIPNRLKETLTQANHPTTVIYNNVKHLAPNLFADDNSVAIRICRDEFCQRLIKAFDKPIVSTSANISGRPTPKSFAQIGDEIAKGVDYIVNLHQSKTNGRPSTIIKLEDNGQLNIIRE